MLLSKRLKAVADLIAPCSRLADIGSDHALLSLYLIRHGKVKQVIIGELGDGPFQRAYKAVQESGLTQAVTVRQGDGLQVLGSGEVESVVLAGLGGDLIEEILSYDLSKSFSFPDYIFQPMSRSRSVRKFLADQGWPIIEEKVIEENGRYYMLIHSQPGTVRYQLTELELDIGPSILKCPSDTNIKYLHYRYYKYKILYSNLLKAKYPNPTEIEICKEKILLMKGILNDDKSK